MRASPLAALPLWALLLIVAVAARAITLGNPILHVDEQFYFVVARAVSEGALPYVDIWDRKPIGLFLLYLPAAALGLPLGIWAYQIAALGFAVATAVLIARLAERAGWRRGAPLAAILYLVWLNLLEGQGGQAPVFYNLAMLSAAWLIAPHPRDAADAGQRFRRGLGAMALVGLALQVKYSAVFEGLFFGLWLLWREWRLHRAPFAVLAKGVCWAGVALAPTFAAWLVYVALDHGDAFVFANFTSILARNADPLTERLGNLATLILLTSPVAAMVALAWCCRQTTDRTLRSLRGWLFAWAGAAALGVLLFGGWFDHYALPMLVPACICAAGFIGEHRNGRRFAVIALVLAFVGGQALLLSKRSSRGTPDQFAAVAAAVGSGSGCLHVYSGETMLYVASRRCPVSRYQFPSHLGRSRETGATGTDQRGELARILRARPEVVVVRAPYRGERSDLRAMVIAELRRHYHLKATLQLGNQRIEVWERR